MVIRAVLPRNTELLAQALRRRFDDLEALAILRREPRMVQ
jgi:hypothetical protein